MAKSLGGNRPDGESSKGRNRGAKCPGAKCHSGETSINRIDKITRSWSLALLPSGM